MAGAKPGRNTVKSPADDDPVTPRPSALTGPLMPVRPWRPLVTATAAASALGSAGCAVAGIPVGVALVGGLGVLAIVLGWARLLSLPSPRGTTGVLAFAAVSLGVTGWSARPGASGLGDLSVVLAALSASVLAAFVHQLARRDGRPRLVESLVSEVSGILLIAAWAASLPDLTRPGATAAVVVVASAVTWAAFADIVRGRWVDDIPAVVIAAGLAAGGAVSADQFVDIGTLSAWVVALAGIIAGLSSYSLRQIFFVQPTQSRSRPQLASGAGSWLLCGVVVSVLVALSSS